MIWNFFKQIILTFCWFLSIILISETWKKNDMKLITKSRRFQKICYWKSDKIWKSLLCNKCLIFTCHTRMSLSQLNLAFRRKKCHNSQKCLLLFRMIITLKLDTKKMTHSESSKQQLKLYFRISWFMQYQKTILCSEFTVILWKIFWQNIYMMQN